MAQAAKADAFTPEFMLDPYPEIARLRREDPAHFVEHMGLWYVTRHDDVKWLLSDDEFATPDQRAWEFYQPAPEGSSTRWFAEHNLFALARDDHRRVRRLASAAFTPRAIERMDGQIVDVVARFAAPLRGRTGVVDVMQEFTDPIPNTVISRITGIPAAGGDEVRFRLLAQAVIANALPFAPEEVVTEAEEAMGELSGWVRQMAAERMESPQDDLISDLVTTHDMGDQMTHDEIVTLVAGLVSAGSETTAMAAVVAIISLLEHPSVFEDIRRDRSLVPQAVVEVIRHGMGGGAGLPHYAVKDFELHGKQIRAGQMLMLSFGGANRDPDVFEDPDAFDIGRDNSKLLMFGYGPHYCLGVHLAKAELKAVMDALCDVLPADAEIREDLMTYRPVGMFKRPTNFPVDFG